MLMKDTGLLFSVFIFYVLIRFFLSKLCWPDDTGWKQFSSFSERIYVMLPLFYPKYLIKLGPQSWGREGKQRF